MNCLRLKKGKYMWKPEDRLRCAAISVHYYLKGYSNATGSGQLKPVFFKTKSLAQAALKRIKQVRKECKKV